jgi:hypothetical protein
MITGNKTYDQLYWDKEFVENRIKAQKRELTKISLKCSCTNWNNGKWVPDQTTREFEVYESAEGVLKRFERQLELINKLK